MAIVLAQNGYTIAMVGSRSEEKAQPAIDKVKQVATVRLPDSLFIFVSPCDRVMSDISKQTFLNLARNLFV